MNEDKIKKDLEDILLSKLELFEEIHEITLKQMELIENREWKKVLNILNTKQRKIDKIDRIDVLYKKKKGNLEIDNDHIYKEINNKIKEIEKIEKENITNMNSIKTIMSKELKSVLVKKKVNTVYSDKIEVQKDGYFIDKFK